MNDIIVDLTKIENLSPCEKKVACIVFNKHGIKIGSGFNHTIDGSPCEEHGVTSVNVVHAEKHCINGLLDTSKPCIMFITCSPCINCAKLIYISGIKYVFYLKEYRLIDGLKFLQKNGIFIQKIFS